MSIEENKALMRRFYEEISKGNLAVVDELIAADVVEHSPFVPGQTPGRQGTLELFTMISAASPYTRLNLVLHSHYPANSLLCSALSPLYLTTVEQSYYSHRLLGRIDTFPSGA
jgi:hypothetical protein